MGAIMNSNAKLCITILVLGVVTAAPVFAGSLYFTDGRADWHSTQCSKPAAPPALTSMSPETPADDLNAKMRVYNAYTQQVQTYMNCVSDEAQKDANAASQAITASAQAVIGQTETELSALQPQSR
jgi:hypothetical protein